MLMLNLLLPNASMYILHIVLLSPRHVEFIKKSRSSLVGGFFNSCELRDHWVNNKWF